MSGATSRAPGSPKDEKEKEVSHEKQHEGQKKKEGGEEEEDDEEPDWE